MPSFLPPKRHGQHRAAAFALFRALLRQSSAIALHGENRLALQNIVRNQFKINRALSSERLLRNAFIAGYKAVDHLDAAVTGDEASIAHIRQLLSRASSSLRKPFQRLLSGTSERPFHTGSSVLERPLPTKELKGKRIVPILVYANNIPFLRFKKPQPRNLSLLISDRIRQRESRILRLEEAYEMHAIANWEDQWDQIVAQEIDAENVVSRQTVPQKPLWRQEWGLEIEIIKRYRDEQRLKNAILAAKMHDVVVREQNLANEEEQQERRLQEPQLDAAKV